MKTQQQLRQGQPEMKQAPKKSLKEADRLGSTGVRLAAVIDRVIVAS